jgi:hypothetical protein
MLEAGEEAARRARFAQRAARKRDTVMDTLRAQGVMNAERESLGIAVSAALHISSDHGIGKVKDALGTTLEAAVSGYIRTAIEFDDEPGARLVSRVTLALPLIHQQLDLRALGDDTNPASPERAALQIKNFLIKHHMVDNTVREIGSRIILFSQVICRQIGPVALNDPVVLGAIRESIYKGCIDLICEDVQRLMEVPGYSMEQIAEQMDANPVLRPDERWQSQLVGDVRPVDEGGAWARRTAQTGLAQIYYEKLHSGQSRDDAVRSIVDRTPGDQSCMQQVKDCIRQARGSAMSV